MKGWTLAMASLLSAGLSANADVIASERFLARAALTKTLAQDHTHGSVGLVSARQNWKHLTPDLCCHTLTPIRIGARTYTKGLGAHANGHAVFRLNGAFARFVAEVGIDNNADTGGVRGSVVFVVKADGAEKARTPICRSGKAPRRVTVPVQGVTKLELIVTDADDGYSFDQADWADAQLIDGAGHVTYLSDVLRASRESPFLAQTRLPASFVYNGQPSDALLPTWSREEKDPVRHGDRIAHEVTWREPGGGLIATWHADTLLDSGAMELRWTFHNDGTLPAGRLTQVLALDLEADVPPDAARLVHSSGGLTGGMDAPDLGFAVSETRLGSATLSGAGGRSSNRDLPFFLVHADDDVGGIYVGIGWSGQWQATLRHVDGKLRIAAEMPGTDLSLPPGETLLTPSALIGAYGGPASAGANDLRRVLHDDFMPALGASKPLPPVSWNSWFVLGNGISQAILEKQADLAAKVGIEYFCIDAGWFDGDFPDGVGNWTINRSKFPQGLGPIGRYVAERGMKLGLWFEPERVAAGTRLLREHPEWVHGDLLDLGNHDAREWVFTMMTRYIDEGHVRWIRFDFNTDPLGTWERMDTPDTRGLSQARHIAGLYDLLDRLRERYPDLLIEGCASGGRRIDLETVKRSHTFWKSDDTANLPVMRFHETGANEFLPGGLLNANLLSIGGPFDVHSLFGGPLGFGADWSRLSAPRLAQARRIVAAYKGLRHLLNEDYCPLFPQRRDESGWIGWQFSDPKTGEGCAIVLRSPDSSYGSADLKLGGIEADRTYGVTNVATGRTEQVTGARLAAGWPVTLPANGSCVFRYRPTPTRSAGAKRGG